MSTSEDRVLVSAIVSAYNSERFMRGCLEDLESQTLSESLEIIVVDSGSEQNEQAVVREFQKDHKNIVYLRTEVREPIYAAWNRGIQAARGRYITNANTDDRHRNDAFERMVRVLESDRGVSLVYADAYITIEENMMFDSAHVVSQFLWPDFDPQLLFRMCYVGPQPMWRRELHERYGYFDPEYRSAGDYEFWLRIVRNERFHHIPERLGLYLLSPTGVERRDEMLSHYEAEKARDRYWPAEWGKRPQPFFVPAYASPAAQLCGAYSLKPGKKSEPVCIPNDVLSGRTVDKPLVSVIVPTYNRPHMLAVALNSIFTQSYKHIEAIVINDGGEDVSDVIAPFEGIGDIAHIRLSRRKGPAAARNAGLRRAKGKYITYLDDDDIYYPQHVETLVRFMECGGHKVAYSDSYQAFQEWDGRRFMTVRKKRHGQDFDKQRLLIKDYIPILSIMHRKECIEETGLFDEGLEVHEDWDLLIRLSRRFDFSRVNVPTSEFRTRDTQDSITSHDFRNFLDTLKKIHSRYSHYVSEPRIEKARKAIVDVHEAKILQKERVEISSMNLPNTTGEAVNEKITVIITAGGGSEGIVNLHKKIMAQKRVNIVELIVIAEGSGEGLFQGADELGPKVVFLPCGEHSLGQSLDLAVSRSSGKYIVFTDQNAQPVSNYWIYNMIRPFICCPELDAITCRRFLRPESDLFSLWQDAERTNSVCFASDSISVFRGGMDIVNWRFFDREVKSRLTCFDRVSSCVRREAAANLRFCTSGDAVDISRDFGIRLLEGGRRLGYLNSTGTYYRTLCSPVTMMKQAYNEAKDLHIIMNGIPNFFEINNICWERIQSDLLWICRSIHSMIANTRKVDMNPIAAVKGFITALQHDLDKCSGQTVNDSRTMMSGEDGGLGDLVLQVTGGERPVNDLLQDYTENIFFSGFMDRFRRFSEYLCGKLRTLEGRQEDFNSCIYKMVAVTAGEVLGSFFVESATMDTLTHEMERVDRILKEHDRNQK